jgi:SNF family Na+-dependent transporter
MVYVTCLLPYVILTILLIKGLTLEGCGKGIKFLFVPNWEIVGKTETWKSAAIQILFSSGVAYGPFLYYGSARGKSDKIVSASFWIPLANSATSIYAALTIFAFLGHVSETKDIKMEDVSVSGPTLLFVAFPSLLGLLPGSNFWAVLFFAMCVCLGVDSVFAFFDYYIQMAEDAFPLLKNKMRKEVQVLGITVFSFIWSLLVLFLQSLFLPWVVGMHKLSQLIYFRTGEYVPVFYVLVIRIFVPIFSFIILIIAIVNEFDTDGRYAMGWNAGHIWGARIWWMAPLVILVVLAFVPLKNLEVFDDLLQKQYGIKFDDSQMTLPQKLYSNKCAYTVTD